MSKKLMAKLRSMSNEELKKRITELRSEIVKERATIASGARPDNPGKVRKLRREIARCLTILNERGGS